MNLEEFIQLIEDEFYSYIKQQQKEKCNWTSDDFKLINRFKHSLIRRFEDAEQSR